MMWLVRLLLVGGMAVSAAHADPDLMQRPELRQFVDDMVTRHDLNAVEVTNLLAQARYQRKVIDAIRKPAEGKPWHQYRQIFLTDRRIQDGVTFWGSMNDALVRAEQQFGVPAEIIVGILGVETFYGTQTGNFRVLDALYTLAFDYPERAEFFRGELENLLLLVREEKIDPLSLTGSYAGAIGKPQFIPSSYRRFAVDFDGDGKKDLINSTADAIGSVANYFRQHQWQPGQQVITAAKIEGDAYRGLLQQGLKPHTNLLSLPGYGIAIASGDLPGTDLGALIEFQNATGPEYWVGLQNFYVITRYNRSPLYAMAVYQLAQEVRSQRDASVAKN